MKALEIKNGVIRRKKTLPKPTGIWILLTMVVAGILLIVTDIVRGTINNGAFAAPGIILLVMGIIIGVIYAVEKHDNKENLFFTSQYHQVHANYFIQNDYMWHDLYNQAVNDYFEAVLSDKENTDYDAWKIQFENMNQEMKKINSNVNILDKRKPGQDYAGMMKSMNDLDEEFGIK